MSKLLVITQEFLVLKLGRRKISFCLLMCMCSTSVMWIYSCICSSCLSAILEEAGTSKIADVGDFNAAVNTVFASEQTEWCKYEAMAISYMVFSGSGPEVHTFVSPANNTTSWLDHIICSTDMHNIISDVHVLNQMPCTDHLPFSSGSECRPLGHLLSTCSM